MRTPQKKPGKKEPKKERKPFPFSPGQRVKAVVEGRKRTVVVLKPSRDREKAVVLVKITHKRKPTTKAKDEHARLESKANDVKRKLNALLEKPHWMVDYAEEDALWSEHQAIVRRMDALIDPRPVTMKNVVSIPVAELTVKENEGRRYKRVSNTQRRKSRRKSHLQTARKDINAGKSRKRVQREMRKKGLTGPVGKVAPKRGGMKAGKNKGFGR